MVAVRCVSTHWGLFHTPSLSSFLKGFEGWRRAWEQELLWALGIPCRIGMEHPRHLRTCEMIFAVGNSMIFEDFFWDSSWSYRGILVSATLVWLQVPSPLILYKILFGSAQTPCIFFSGIRYPECIGVSHLSAGMGCHKMGCFPISRRSWIPFRQVRSSRNYRSLLIWLTQRAWEPGCIAVDLLDMASICGFWVGWIPT